LRRSRDVKSTDADNNHRVTSGALLCDYEAYVRPHLVERIGHGLDQLFHAVPFRPETDRDPSNPPPRA
jgi:hypothetical protein